MEEFRSLLPEAVNRFLNYCETHHIQPTVRDLPGSTHSAIQAAQALGCNPAQIVKSLLFIGRESGQACLVLVSGKNKANPQRLAEILGEKVRLASAEEVFAITGYAVGAVTPAGLKQAVPTFIDEDLIPRELLWVSGGSDHTLAAINYEELLTLTGGKVVNIQVPQAAPVEVLPYDPNWPIRFSLEKQRLVTAAGKYIPRFEHIGSTSVPGLSAKPIIDILGGADSLADDIHFVPVIERMGYQYIPEYEVQMPWRRYFTFKERGKVIIHLHIVTLQSEFWEKHLAFRDLLRSDPALRDAYGKLKIKLARKYGQDRIAYTNAKSDFINKALTR